MTNRSRITSLIAAVLMVGSTAALITGSTAALAQGSSSANKGSSVALPGTSTQIASCDIGKSKGPLGY